MTGQMENPGALAGASGAEFEAANFQGEAYSLGDCQATETGPVEAPPLGAAVLQIPADVGEYCRQAAKILGSSVRYLDHHIQQQRAWAEDDNDEDWFFDIPHAEAEITRANIAKAAELLAFLAEHGQHGQPVEAQE